MKTFEAKARLPVHVSHVSTLNTSVGMSIAAVAALLCLQMQL
jgi:hypothetical protein